MQNTKWLPSARITNSLDLTICKVFMPFLNSRYLGLKQAPGFFRQPTMVIKMLLLNYT